MFHVVFSDLSLHSFSSTEMNEMELSLLSALHYNLYIVTPFDFLLFLLHQVPTPPSLVFFAFVCA